MGCGLDTVGIEILREFCVDDVALLVVSEGCVGISEVFR